MNTSKRNKKKLTILGIVLATMLTIAFLYPYGKKILDYKYTFFRPVTYGKELIYGYINKGDVNVANKILTNQYEVDRFDPIEITNITWNEDPYKDIYWRFNFYNLEPVRHLFFAWKETGNDKYKDKLIEILTSFLDKGMGGPYSWDFHGTAFRLMTLINVREKLGSENLLSPELDTKIIEALKKHGEFLSDPEHYEKEYNHGLDQAVALFLLSVNYPEMSDSSQWRTLAEQRIREVVDGIIDADGVLVENSPYYHLYVLEKLYEIEKYLGQNRLTVPGLDNSKIEGMISYVVYMLQPNLDVPTIGASISRSVGLSDIYREIASKRSDLLYVLSQGRYGDKPAKQNVYYPVSGQTIMRSGWEKGKSYVNQTQLFFDVGNYRTNHSDLDALSFSLYGGGIVLMPDAGLYSYASGPYRDYFHGTRSHNTVVVDGKDQSTGDRIIDGVTAGSFVEGDGYVYQSGNSNLYNGVSHMRSIMLIEDSTVLIVDKLKSDEEHDYEQIFHLFPGSKVKYDGLSVSASGSNPEEELTIKQYVTEGLEVKSAYDKHTPPDGLCSQKYNSMIPCEAVSYVRKGRNVSYLTSIQIGKNNSEISYENDTDVLRVKTKNNEYSVRISEIENIERRLDVSKLSDKAGATLHPQLISSLNDLWGWKIDNANVANNNIVNNTLEIITPSDGSYVNFEKDTMLDLSNKNIFFKLKVDNTANLQGVDLSLSNNNWEAEATYYIDQVFDFNYRNREDEWLSFSVGKSQLRNIRQGGWLFTNNKAINWSTIDKIRITASSKHGASSKINIKGFSLVPDQKEARAIIVFDDGWYSVMDAADRMNKYGLKGNVAVITNSIGKKSFLSLTDIRTLQNDFGWNIVNHSSLHKDAVAEYVKKNNLSMLDTDVNNALHYLVTNGINSAPNWYIYPNGSTDRNVQEIIGRYYKFARSTINVPQTYPFVEPLNIGVFQVYSDRANVSDVNVAIRDAIKYKQTLILMFHKFTNGKPTMFTEFSIDDFESIMKILSTTGIKTVTFSELDKENNVPETEFKYYEAVPGQIKLDVFKNLMVEENRHVKIKKLDNTLYF